MFSETYVLVLGAYYKLQTFYLYLSRMELSRGSVLWSASHYGAGESGVEQIFRTALYLTAGVMAVEWCFPS